MLVQILIIRVTDKTVSLWCWIEAPRNSFTLFKLLMMKDVINNYQQDRIDIFEYADYSLSLDSDHYGTFW